MEMGVEDGDKSINTFPELIGHQHVRHFGWNASRHFGEARWNEQDDTHSIVNKHARRAALETDNSSGYTASLIFMWYLFIQGAYVR